MRSAFKLLMLLAAMYSFASRADASIELEFDNTAGAVLQFGSGDAAISNDGTFEFQGDFMISAVNGSGVSPAVSLLGRFIGEFTMDAITPAISIAPGITWQSSNVSAPGDAMLVIDDDEGHVFSAAITEISEIATVNNLGAIHAKATANIGQGTYAGDNQDLKDLASYLESISQWTFTAPVGQMLSTLADEGVGVNDWSGLITTQGEPVGDSELVPEPASVSVWAALAFIVGAVMYKRRGSTLT